MSFTAPSAWNKVPGESRPRSLSGPVLSPCAKEMPGVQNGGGAEFSNNDPSPFGFLLGELTNMGYSGPS